MMICIAGKNSIAVNALWHLVDGGFSKDELCVCINRTDTGKHGWQPSLKATAELLGINIVDLPELYDTEDLHFFSLEFDQLIKPHAFRSNTLINLHFSLLPAYKGMYTSVMPLLHGKDRSGVTLHLIDDGIDTGEIIERKDYKIGPDMNARDVYMKNMECGLDLFKQALPLILREDYETVPQPQKGSSYFSKKEINFDAIALDLNKTAYEVKNQIRAFAFREYQLPAFFGSEISHACITQERSVARAGELIEETPTNFHLSTIDYNIRLYKNHLPQILEDARTGELYNLKKYHDSGYKLYEKDERGGNALSMAVRGGHHTAVQWLLANGLDPNTQDYNGRNILFYALDLVHESPNHSNMISLLLDNGASTSQRDYQGVSPKQYARSLAIEM